ncbi:hypothetical protein DDE74_39825 [Streptomyces lydicus]|uniref:Uncharacterized protein n=1 Tax=Streptomyces lydicus TaxID=47763 RepID=A0A3S9YMB3_9ACTN|nr:hypothetical protein [Streptomyces lydicus]AZS76172.1 hypothetical protein DDE74_39825 [Streptomyces lydicus]
MSAHEPTGNQSQGQRFVKPITARQRSWGERWQRPLRRLSGEATTGLVRGASSALGTAIVGWVVLWYQHR